MVGDSTYKDYLRKTLWWLLGNIVFGLAPLLFMMIVYLTADQKIGAIEIHQFIHDGVVLFVLCAIMGSIMLDYAIGGYTFKSYQVFFIFIFPILILSMLCLNYLLIRIGYIKDDRFDLSSFTSILVTGLSLLYIIRAKTSLFIKEDTKTHST